MKRGLSEQIEEVSRVLSSHERVYPDCIRLGHMTQDEANEHLSRQRAVLATLRWLQANEQAVRTAVT